MKNEHRTEIATLGEFGLIDRICKPFVARNPTTVEGCGDDAAVIDAGDRYLLLSTDLMLEGVDFDLTYFPLQHLGYKSVVRGISDILAMNGTPRQIMLSLGISSRFSVEMIDAFYEGVRAACERYGLSTMVYVGTKLYMTPYDELMFSRYKSNEGYLAVKTVVPSVAEVVAEQHLPVDKVFTRSQNPQHLQFVRSQLASVEGIRVMSSADDNVEIIAPHADKGRALGELCARFGTDLAHAAAIGDSENDREMLLAVGMPIAMGNAREDIKQLCRFTTRTNAEDGVAHAIYTLLGQ